MSALRGSRILFRIATDEDLPSLLVMMDDFNRSEEIAWSAERGAPALGKLLSDPSLGLVTIVESDGVRAGYFILTWGFDLEWNGRDAILTEIYVVPELRGKGVGTAALAAAERCAEEHGAGALHLMVRHENTGALRLYERAGFTSPPRAFMTKVMRPEKRS